MTQPNKPAYVLPPGPPPDVPQEIRFQVNHLLHFILTVITFGMWVMVWIPLALIKMGQRSSAWRTYYQEREAWNQANVTYQQYHH